MLQILEHASEKYSPRTYHNAKMSNVTVALAVDYETAGEKCTHKAAGAKYFALPLFGETKSPLVAARNLYRYLRDNDLQNPVINIAGNGLYTAAKHHWTQDALNLHLLAILSLVHAHWPIGRVISGGQTGVDQAGLVAAYVLGIDAIGLLPKGFIQRGKNGKDVSCTAEQIRQQIEGEADFARMALSTVIGGSGGD